MRKLLSVFIVVVISFFAATAQSPAFPFPNHSVYAAGTIKPNVVSQAGLDKVVRQFYDKWKNRYLVAGCDPGHYYVFYNFEGFADPANAICVSEAQGYGMMITAIMGGYDPNAKVYFDGLYQYYKAHPSIINSTLMAWQQIVGCENVAGADAATDGDLDIAYALLLAHCQWGSGGAINYLDEAINLINAIYTSEINHNNQSVKLGDWVSGSVSPMSYSTRSSDFMPDHFNSFFDATSDNNWNLAVNRCYSTIDAIQTNFSSTTGLMPDFIRHTNTAADPAAPNFLESEYDGDYYYNACRFPWRIATDYLVNGDVRAYDALASINTWVKTKTSSIPSNIKSGYDLNLGTVLPGSNYNDLAFQAPFAVAAMIDNTNQAWLNSLWNYMKTVNINRDGYYGNSIKLLSLIVISGNWWAPDPALLRQAQNNFGNNVSLSVFPNPVGDNEIYVNVGCNDCDNLSYKLVSITGVETGIAGELTSDDNQIKINIAELQPGIYFIEINNGNSKTIKQFIKL